MISTRAVYASLGIPAVGYALSACAWMSSPPAPVPAVATPTSPEITAADLRTRLFIVADDSTAGRLAGSEGAAIVQRYIERELRRLGLTPAGENGTYLQTIRTVVRRVGSSTLVRADGRPLALWTDLVAIPWPWMPRAQDSVRVVYGGTLGDPAGIDSAAAAGALVILRNPPGRMVFPRIAPSDRLGRAWGVAVVGLEGYAPARLELIRRGIHAGLEGDRTQRDTAPVSLVIATAVAESLLGKRLDDAQVGDTGVTMRGSVTFSDSTAALCCNVIALIPGSDPRLAGQYVALGAHLDHAGTLPAGLDHDSARAALRALWDMRGRSSAGRLPRDAPDSVVVNVDSLHRLRPRRIDAVFNGADDDGSGVVALLEIAESLSRDGPKPQRSVLFVWHTAEERGILGSTWLTDHPTVPLDSIVVQLNVDMVGRGSATDIAGGGPHYLQVIGARRLSTELGRLIEQVNVETRAGFRFDYRYDTPRDPRALYCRSDHFAYARYGIPIAFFTTGEHADYHQVTDEPQYIDYPHLAAVTRFLRDVTLRLANLDHRVVIDRPRPDPRAPCTG